MGQEAHLGERVNHHAVRLGFRCGFDPKGLLEDARLCGNTGWRLPFPPWEELDKTGAAKDLDADMRAVIDARATDMPFGPARQPVSLASTGRAKLPKTAIWCTTSSQQVKQIVDSGNPMFKELAGPEWTFTELRTGHWPMFSKPRELANLLLQQV